MRRCILALLAGILSALAGASGFALVPDTGLYETGNAPLWSSPIASVIPLGHETLIILSALAAATCVFFVRKHRFLYVVVTAWWFAFPGVDALAMTFLLFAFRGRFTPINRTDGNPAPETSRKVQICTCLTTAALLHPVVLVGAPLVALRNRYLAIATTAALAIAAVGFVGTVDGTTTADRYFLPLVTGLVL